MKKVNVFKDWMVARGYSKGVCESVFSRKNRIAAAYDIEAEYLRDHCAEMLEDFTYTAADAKNGVLPNVRLTIQGDYRTGLLSLKRALEFYVAFLEETYKPAPAVTAKPSKARKSGCIFEGDIDGFIAYLGPKWRNVVQTHTKAHKKLLGGCECCGAVKTLEAAHRAGFERLDIIKRILAGYEIAPGRYRVDLGEFWEKYLLAHTPLQNVFFFLCKKCHNVYDGKDPVKSKQVEDAVLQNRG